MGGKRRGRGRGKHPRRRDVEEPRAAGAAPDGTAAPAGNPAVSLARPSLPPSLGTWLRRAAVLLALVVVLLVGRSIVATVRDPVGERPPAGFTALLAETDYVTSESCMPCHLEQGPSWEDTFHRTMTQVASEESVLAPFDGRTIEILGVTTRVYRDDDGVYVMETAHPKTGEPTRFPIVMTVGSGRMQQYVTKLGDRHVRLPLGWSVEEDRWFHMQEAFFSDSEEFHKHTNYWDYNCIFCHNTKPTTGIHDRTPIPDVVQEFGIPPVFPGSYDAHMEEMGIACEACHGPGDEHARRMRSPVRRYAFHATDERDPTIVNPASIDRQRGLDVCAHCHGQRITASIEKGIESVREADPFTPGEPLAESWETIWHDTVWRGYTFEPRFWKDGAPRFTAYEYQGLKRSPCFADPEFDCLSCHTMHGGNPRGQMRPEMTGDAMCLQCHGEFRGEKLAEHTRHEPDGAGSRCVACHMPGDVYGVLDFHASHEIGSPDPALSARYEKPDACTLCHSGRSIRWAAQKTRELWPGFGSDPAGLDEQYGLAELPRALQSAEAVYRTLAARRMGDAPSDEGVDPEWFVPLLADALGDPYANVRRNARRSLMAILEDDAVPLPFDDARRAAYRDELLSRPLDSALPPELASFFRTDGTLDLEKLAGMKERRVDLPFSIGE